METTLVVYKEGQGISKLDAKGGGVVRWWTRSLIILSMFQLTYMYQLYTRFYHIAKLVLNVMHVITITSIFYFHNTRTVKNVKHLYTNKD